MKRIPILVLFISLFVSTPTLKAQTNKIANDSIIYSIVDTLPVLITQDKEYKLEDIKEFIKLNLKYPQNGLDCEGRVYISFVVEIDGTISNKKFVRKLCDGFDENAMEVIGLMTQWKPGVKNGVPVRTRVNLSISFL